MLKPIGFGIIAATLLAMAHSHGIDISPWWVLPLGIGVGLMSVDEENNRDC